MNILLATAYPTRWTYLPLFEGLARRDRFGVHTLCGDPDHADVILFVDARSEHGDWSFKALRQHPFMRRYREKSFLYNETDQPFCVLPGLYVSMPGSHFNSQRQRAWCYASSKNDDIEAAAQVSDPDYLFSFMGRRCHPSREMMLNFKHPQSFVQDTSEYNYFGDAKGDIDAQKRRYADVLARSKFVLCPRGAGPASYRLFETMAAGRVPVIVSDEWVAPDGPDWNACAIRVAEADVAQIPALLEANKARYEPMARAARHEWEQWFAPDVLFHRMVEGCKDILDNRRLPEAFWQRLPDRRRLRLQARVAKAHVVARLRKRTP